MSIATLLFLLLSLSLASAAEPSQPAAAGFSDPSQVEGREYVTVCPTDGRRGVRVDPENAQQAQIVTTNCAAEESVAVSETGQLDLSHASLDLVLSYPDAETLNLAFNALEYFPSDASVVALRSLILRGNRFRSLTDVEMPPELEYLDLSYCQVTTLASKSSYPHSLVKLRLAGNKLSSLKDMTFPKTLRALELDHQLLLSLEGAAFPPSLEILTAANVSLTKLNASSVLPDSLATVDVSSNSLTQFPDFYAFPSVAEVNASSNAIASIAGVQFPWTLKRLDLRGNPLKELEVTRSDLKLFQAWSYLLPKLNQSECRNAEARKVKLTDVELCVLEDEDFNRIYGTSTAADEAGSLDGPSPTPETSSPSNTIQNVDPATRTASSQRNPFTWAFLIIAIVVIAIVVIGVISMISWKHQQLRRKVKRILDRNSHIRTSSFNDDLLHAVGLEGELIATRFDSEEIKILHVLGKNGYGLLYLAAMRNGDDMDDGDAAPTPKLLVIEEQDRRSAISALSLQDLETKTILASGRQLVTLKRVVPEQCTPKSLVLRAFVQEIQLMAQLDHPKIVAFLGVYWNTLSDVTMVLEYLSNGDLRTMLRVENDRLKFGQSKRLCWKESQTSFASTMSVRTAVLPSKCAIALNVADALVYLHSLDPPVLHRELRSKHVLFSEHYDAKLSGIGAPSDLPLDLAKTAALDSVAWIAPETLRGERHTEKTDVYALGILLTELATGLPPFDGLASAAVVVKVAHANERPSLQGDADCPDLVR